MQIGGSADSKGEGENFLIFTIANEIFWIT
jgi:hypothetical protein